MFPTLRKLTLLAAAAILGASIASAQTGAMEGDVKDENGQPLKGALVKITRTDIKGNYKVKTDKKGHYFHAGLPMGRYDVALEVEGTDRDNVKGVQVRLGDPTAVNFDLQGQKAQREAQAKAMEKGEVTKEMERSMSPEQKAALEKAMKERTAAMAKNKELNDAFNAGREALTAKNYPVAVEQLTKASTLDPKQHVVWGNLAEAHAGLAPTDATNYDKAFDAYNKAIELAPSDANYFNNYALLLARAKKYDEAKTQLEKAAALDAPNAGRYYFNLGAIYVNAGNYGPAEEAFKSSIAADPNYADAHYQYGVCLMAKAQTKPDGSVVPPAGTKEAFEKYLQLKPDGRDAEGAKGMLAAIGEKVQTTYENPDAKKKAAPRPAPKKK